MAEQPPFNSMFEITKITQKDRSSSLEFEDEKCDKRKQDKLNEVKAIASCNNIC